VNRKAHERTWWAGCRAIGGTDGVERYVVVAIIEISALG
jgi:hypothetical protein